MNKSRFFVGSFYGLLILLVISLGLFIGCQPATKQLPPEMDETLPQVEIEQDNIKHHIKILTAKEFEGRRAGTAGDAETALYLAQELKKNNIKPLGTNNTYFQTFPLPLTGLKWEDSRLVFYLINEKSKLVSDNVLGLIESSQRPNEYIIISAHYDHLGSLDKQLYPGANDNASGVAAILEMARILMSQEKLPYSVIIALWGGEEMGLIGSNFFVANPPVNPEQIKLIINLDSIGSGARNDFIMWSGGSLGVVQSLYHHLQRWEDGEFEVENTLKNSSDHKPFTQLQIPAATILAADWLKKNHTALDNSLLLNYGKIVYLAENLSELLSSEQIEKILQD